MLKHASRPWWIIGSAAVVLHGAVVQVGDVDVLMDEQDAAQLSEAGLTWRLGEPDGRFRSTLFSRWTEPPLVVEFMAGLHVAKPGGWSPVQLATRDAVAIGPVTLFVPGRMELQDLLLRFGRAKDVARAALLRPE